MICQKNLNFAPFLHWYKIWSVNENDFCWRSRASREYEMNTNNLAHNYFVDGVTDVSRKAIFLVRSIRAGFLWNLVTTFLFLDRIEIRPEKSQSTVYRTAAPGPSTNRRWRHERIIRCKHFTEYNFSIRKNSQRTAKSCVRIAFVVIGTASADYRFVARVLRRCSCRQRKWRSRLWCGSNAHRFYRILPSALHDHRGHTKCCRLNVMPSSWTVRQHYFNRFRCNTIISSILWTFSFQILSIVLFRCGKLLPRRRRQFECVPTTNTRNAEQPIKTCIENLKKTKKMVFLLDSNESWRQTPSHFR